MNTSVSHPGNPGPNLAAVLQARDLGHSYGGAPSLAGLNFSLRPGLSLVRGGDGSGKTTLLRLMAGSLQPGSGTLLRNVATVFHVDMREPSLDTVVARAWLDAERGARPGWRPALEAALIDAFGLQSHTGKTLAMLSTGSRRKLGWVAAAASGAALTLIDQPFAALDAASCRVLAELLMDAADDPERVWVVADHEASAHLQGVRWAGVIDLGDG